MPPSCFSDILYVRGRLSLLQTHLGSRCRGSSNGQGMSEGVEGVVGSLLVSYAF